MSEKNTTSPTTLETQPTMNRSTGWLSNLVDHIQPSEELMLVMTAVLVGIGTGLGAVVFNTFIRWVTDFSFTTLPNLLPMLGRWILIIVPTIGGLLAGPLIFYFAREAKGHGVPEVMEAIVLKGGRIRPIVVVIKAVASSLSIGTGGSVGREGPIVQIGAALGSTLAQALHLSDDRIRNLVACGAGGGIAATFNAPIAGVIFALEVVLGELSIGHVGTIVISAVTANTVTRAISGSAYAFPVPQPYTINSLWEYAFYALLGILAAGVATLFVRTLYGAEDVFAEQPFVPEWAQPAVGGLLLGALALLYPLIFPTLQFQGLPQVFGGGYPPITAALSNKVLLGAAIILIFLKMAATNLTLGSGGSGGIFAPSLFMGAMLGVAFGIGLDSFFPGLNVQPGAYALVGMGAVFAGAARAPITAVVMLFELTGDYRIVLPLMLTVIISTILCRSLLHDESIYTLKLTRRGIRLQSGRDVDILQAVTVEEAMTHDADTVPAAMTLVELSEAFSNSRHHGFAVLDEQKRLWGVVTISDLERALARNAARSTPVSEIGTGNADLQVVYPDDTMDTVLSRMGTRGLGRLPVVSRLDRHHLLGLIRREDVISAYRTALTRRAELQHRAKRMRLRNIDNTEFLEIPLTEQCAAVGQSLAEVAGQLPDECIVISIRRGNRVLIPHGDTVFHGGDRVTAFVRSRAVPDLYTCLLGPDLPGAGD